MERTANAVWRKGLKDGSGNFSTSSGVLRDISYTFATRFENAPGTNPEELVAAAHAACFSMALSAQLGEQGITPDSVETTCTITFENLTLTRSKLDVVVHAPGADQTKFESAASNAKSGCPISKVLNLDIQMNARLER